MSSRTSTFAVCLAALTIAGLCPAVLSAACRPELREIPHPLGPRHDPGPGSCRDGNCTGTARPPWCDPRLIGPGHTVRPCTPWQLGRVRVDSYGWEAEELVLELSTDCHPGEVAVWSPAWDLPPLTGTLWEREPAAVWRAPRGSAVSGEVRFTPSPAGCDPCDVRVSWWAAGSPRRHHSDHGWAFRDGPVPVARGRGERARLGPFYWRHDLTELGRRVRGMHGPVLDFRR